jgi:hypothetical protein
VEKTQKKVSELRSLASERLGQSDYFVRAADALEAADKLAAAVRALPTSMLTLSVTSDGIAGALSIRIPLAAADVTVALFQTCAMHWEAMGRGEGIAEAVVRFRAESEERGDV